MSSQNGSGRRWKPRQFKVTFAEGHDFEGLEVHLRPAPVAKLLDLSASLDGLQGIGDGAALTGAQSEGFRSLIRELAPLITWWNVDDDDGQPVAPDEAGLLAQEPMLILTLVEAWVDRQSKVAPPLPRSSANGSKAAEEELSLPMAPLPASHPS